MNIAESLGVQIVVSMLTIDTSFSVGQFVIFCGSLGLLLDHSHVAWLSFAFSLLCQGRVWRALAISSLDPTTISPVLLAEPILDSSWENRLSLSLSPSVFCMWFGVVCMLPQVGCMQFVSNVVGVVSECFLPEVAVISEKVACWNQFCV